MTRRRPAGAPALAGSHRRRSQTRMLGSTEAEPRRLPMARPVPANVPGPVPGLACCWHYCRCCLCCCCAASLRGAAQAVQRASQGKQGLVDTLGDGHPRHQAASPVPCCSGWHDAGHCPYGPAARPSSAAGHLPGGGHLGAGWTRQVLEVKGVIDLSPRPLRLLRPVRCSPSARSPRCCRRCPDMLGLVSRNTRQRIRCLLQTR